MTYLTFDHNLIIDLEQHSEGEPFLLKLIEAHKADRVCIRLAGSGYSEVLKDRSLPTTGNEFISLLKAAGIEYLEIQAPIFQLDVSPLDTSVFASEEEIELREKIHRTLFPDDSRTLTTGENEKEQRKRRNREMDASALWCHIHYGGDIFVTRDMNFIKKREALVALGAKSIMTPQEVVKHLNL